MDETEIAIFLSGSSVSISKTDPLGQALRTASRSQASRFLVDVREMEATVNASPLPLPARDLPSRGFPRVSGGVTG
jgi:hypothetical protein